MTESGVDPLDDTERRELLAQISRRTATIGERIPQSIEIDGEPFPLREFVWETKHQGTVPPDRRDEVQSVRARLKEERAERKARLESAELSAEEGLELARSIVGIDRALTALKNLYETDLGEQSHAEYVEGNRRWVAFIDQLTD